MKLQDYCLSAELHSGYKTLATLSFESPVSLDLSILTQIYLKYHGFRFASMFIDYDFDLHLSFQEISQYYDNRLISHSVLLQKPIHISDMRITLIPELIRALDNYDIANGKLILPKVREIYRKIKNED